MADRQIYRCELMCACRSMVPFEGSGYRFWEAVDNWESVNPAASRWYNNTWHNIFLDADVRLRESDREKPSPSIELTFIGTFSLLGCEWLRLTFERRPLYRATYQLRIVTIRTNPGQDESVVDVVDDEYEDDEEFEEGADAE